MPGIETTYNRILSYLKGLLSDRQRHDLEKDVMRDVFEEEAFEGLSQLSADELETDMDILMNRLKDRVKLSKRRDIKFYFRIAAGILLLSGLGVSLYFMLRPPASALLTEDKIIINPVPPAPANEPAPPLTDTSVKDNELKKRIKDNGTGNQADLAENRRQPQKYMMPMPDTGSILSLHDKASEPAAVEFRAGKNADTSITESDDLMALDEMVVVDYGTKAERKNSATIPAKESESKSMSAETVSRELQGKVAGVQVTRKQAMKKDEISSDNVAFSSVVKPVPPGGSLKDFKKWVTDRIDLTAFKSYPGKQRIVVNLTVHTDGTVSDVRIMNSVPPKIALEFKKIILQSPKWKPALSDNVPVEAQVAIRFVITDE